MCTKTSSRWYGIAAILLGAFVTVANVRADNPPWPPLVSVVALDPDAAEQGSDTATFLVVRIGPANTALTVEYELGGEAINGTDYQSLSGIVTIPEGAHFAPVALTPIDDYQIEGSESVVFALQQPPSWPPPYIVTWPSLAVAEIADNDREPTNHPPAVTLTRPPDGAVFESGEDIALVARAFDRDGRVLTVEFFDGTNRVGVVTNRPMHVSANTDLSLQTELNPLFDLSTDAMLDAGVTLDKIPRGQLFRLVWSNAPHGHHVLTAVATDNDGTTIQSAPVEITVLEQPSVPIVSVRATDPIAAEPKPDSDHPDTATFAIHRKGPTNETLRVFYRLGGTASNGVDYVELPHSIEIPAGERAAKVLVEPLDDLLVEGLEKVVLSLMPSPATDAASPLEGDYRIGRAHTAVAWIRDNDTPSNEPPLVRLVEPDDGDVFLAPAEIRLIALARDFDGFVRAVEFFEGTNRLGVVTNHPTSNAIARPAFSLVWSNVPPGRYVLTAVATDNDGAATGSRPVEIRVVPRVVPPEVNIATVDPIATEPGILTVIDPAVFAVTRTANANHALNVFYSIHGTAANGVDYQLLTGRVEIPAGVSSNHIEVIALDDTLVEGTESVVLKLQPHPLTGPDDSRPWWYRIGSNHTARAFIRDNDVSPTNQPPQVALVHPNDGDVFVAPADIQLVARAHDSDGWVRTVEFFEGENSLGIVTNPPLVIANMTDVLPERLFQLKWQNVPPGEYILTALATDNRGASTRSEPVKIRVEPPRPPVVTIHATDPYASEGYWIEPFPEPVMLDANRPIPFPIRPRTAIFTVARHGNTSADLLVHYKLDGTAENGVDYKELSGAVKIPAGETTAEIVVDPIDDNLAEPTETVTASLVPPVCIAIYPPPLDCYSVGDPGEAKAVIFDNDRNQSPHLEIVNPANGDMFVAHSDIEIDVVTRDPDGWVSRMEFFANDEKIGDQQIFFIVAPPPGEVQKFSMIWSNVPAGEYRLMARATDDRGGMALSDPVNILVVPVPPVPVVTIHATDPLATEPDPFTDGLPDMATFRVRRAGNDLADALTVFYRVGGTASNGVDYVALSGEVIIPAGQESAPVVIDPLDDNLFEGNESVILSLVQPPCLPNDAAAVGCYLVGRPDRAIAYLRDNDSAPNRPPTVAIVSPANGSVYCAPVDLRLIAAAHDSDGWVTTVEFFDGTNSLGIASNNVVIITDPLDRLPEAGMDLVTANSLVLPFSIVWSNVPPGKHILTAVATDNSGESSTSRPVEIFVREHDELPLVRIMTVDAIAREGTTNTAAFRVRRTGGTNEALTVHYDIRGTADNGVDYQLVPGSVTIPAGRRSARVVITSIHDALPERVETVVLRLTPPPVGPDIYEIGRPRVAAALILDNDCELDGRETFPDGSVHLSLGAQVGTQLRLEATTNLADWEAVGSFKTHAEASSFIDAERASYAQRFFRLVPEFGDLETDD